MRISRAIQEFTLDLRAGGKAKATVEAYQSDLNRVMHHMGHDTVLGLTPDVLTRLFRDLSEANLKLSTLHRKTAAVREFVRWGRRQRLFPDPEALLEAIPKIRRQEPLPRPFSQDEAARLWKLELPSDERVVRALLFFTGLRVGAICRILVGNVSEHPPAIATVTKGGRTVLKPMHPKLAEAIVSYALTRTDLKPQSWLLMRKSGRPLTRRHVEWMTRRWGAAARVAGCLPHRFRHTVATEMLRGGEDIRVIQKVLDHADLKSTAVYTKVHDEQIRGAMLKLPDTWGDGAGT